LKTKVVAKQTDSRQRSLTLSKTPLPPIAKDETTKPLPRSTSEGVSREILLSRVLASVLDFLIALAGGTILSFIASLMTHSPFPSLESVQTALLAAAGFYFFNTVFFLVATGQTHGMALTELKLISEAQKDLTPGTIVIRVLLFVPVVLTVVGVIWGVFDPQRRCWHDRLSGSRVVPTSFQPKKAS
jgi:uncharacterized RDD family membrane protein YckC